MLLLGANREDVRLGLRAIGHHLGRLNLIQQGSKTRILVGSKARQELFDRRPQQIKLLIDGIHSKKTLPLRSRRSILKQLDAFLAKVKDTTRKNESTILTMLYTA